MKNVRLEVDFVCIGSEYYAVFERMYWGERTIYRLMGSDGVPFTGTDVFVNGCLGSVVLNDAYNVLDFLKFINGFEMFPVSLDEFPRIVKMFALECGLSDRENVVFNLTETYDYESEY
jgi:hypothetical protein